MRKRFVEFLRDDRGAVSPEWALMATVLVLGSVAMLAATKVAQPGHFYEMAKVAAGR
jgi:Flp pilus assembly pilin Flp